MSSGNEWLIRKGKKEEKYSGTRRYSILFRALRGGMVIRWRLIKKT